MERRVETLEHVTSAFFYICDFRLSKSSSYFARPINARKSSAKRSAGTLQPSWPAHLDMNPQLKNVISHHCSFSPMSMRAGPGSDRSAPPFPNQAESDSKPQ